MPTARENIALMLKMLSEENFYLSYSDNDQPSYGAFPSHWATKVPASSV